MLELIFVFFSLVVIHYKFRDSMVDLLQNMQDVYAKWEQKAKPITEATGGINGYHRNTWSTGFHGGGPPQSRSFRTRKERNKIPLACIPQASILGQFKMEPAILPDFSGCRPYVGTCCPKCLPSSKQSLVDESVRSLGLKNIFLLPTLNEENGFLTRRFAHLIHFLTCKAGFDYPDVYSEVLECDRVQDAIEQAATQEIENNDLPPEVLSKIVKKHARRARQILENMQSSISSLLIRLTAWTLFKFLGKLLTSIQVHKGQIEAVKRATKSSIPVIYLPTHRSHLDYILVTWILYNHEIRAPIVAAGDNLRIPIIGSLLRGLGAFFIKRKLDAQQGKKDVVYRAILHTYMEKCLRAGHTLEFFIEGGRSRTGKACMPKGGLLSVVVDAFMDGSMPDAYLVPVAISYEKIMDGNFVSEQLGNPKIMESLWSALTAIWRVANSNFGSVRIDFAQPFSLKEFIHSAQGLGIGRTRSSSLCGPAAPVPSTQLQLRRLSSTGSLYGTDGVLEGERQLVKCIAEHITYDAVQCTALMSTNLVSFLLLTKFRKGATFQQLVQAINWLRSEAASRGRDVGFTGETPLVLEHALNLLGPQLVDRQTIESKERTIVFLKPNIEFPHIIELSYYSNVVLSLYAVDSIVVNALYALLDEELEIFQDCESTLTIYRERLQEKALALCDILQFEFIYVPYCSSLEMAVSDAIERLIASEVLSTQMHIVSGDPEEQAWAERFSRNFHVNLDSEDDEIYIPDQQLKVNLSEESIEHLTFLRSVLSPLIESYWLTACSLVLLVRTTLMEKEYLEKARLCFRERREAGLVHYGESGTAEGLRNALKLFETWKVVESCMQDDIKIIYLSDEHDSEARLSTVVESIAEFKK